MTLGRCESEEAGPPLAPVHQARVQPPVPVRGALVAEADVQCPLAHPQLHRQAEPDAQRPASATAAAAAATATTAAEELPAAQHRRANARHMPAAGLVADVSAALPQLERPREPLPHPASGARPAGEAAPLVAQQPLTPLATHKFWAASDADVERRWRERRPGEDVIHWAAGQVALLNNRPAHFPAPARPLPASTAERSSQSEQAADLTTAARSTQPPPAQRPPAAVAEQPRLPEQAAPISAGAMSAPRAPVAPAARLAQLAPAAPAAPTPAPAPAHLAAAPCSSVGTPCGSGVGADSSAASASTAPRQPTAAAAEPAARDQAAQDDWFRVGPASGETSQLPISATHSLIFVSFLYIHPLFSMSSWCLLGVWLPALTQATLLEPAYAFWFV